MPRHSYIMSLLLLAAIAGATTLRAEPAPIAIAQLPGEALVAQLGDQSYAKRESAHAELERRGLAMEKELRAGLLSSDMEVRYHCAQLLVDIVEIARERQFDQFVKDYEADRQKAYDFPAWTKLQKVTGDSKAARELYVEMYRDEPDTMKKLAEPKQSLGTHIDGRARLLQNMLQNRQPGLVQQQQISIGNVAALLLAAGEEDRDVSATAQQMLYNLCAQPMFNNAIRDEKSPLRPVFRRYAGATQDVAAYQCMILMQQMGMKEDSIACAERLLKSKASHAHYRYQAVLQLTNTGDASKIALFEPLLDDATIVMQSSVGAGRGGLIKLGGAQQKLVTTQMRDAALTGVIQLSKQDPKKFGFDKVGFENDEARTKAFDSWKKFKEEEKKKSEEKK